MKQKSLSFPYNILLLVFLSVHSAMVSLSNSPLDKIIYGILALSSLIAIISFWIHQPKMLYKNFTKLQEELHLQKQKLQKQTDTNKQIQSQLNEFATRIGLDTLQKY